MCREELVNKIGEACVVELERLGFVVSEEVEMLNSMVVLGSQFYEVTNSDNLRRHGYEWVERTDEMDCTYGVWTNGKFQIFECYGGGGVVSIDPLVPVGGGVEEADASGRREVPIDGSRQKEAIIWWDEAEVAETLYWESITKYPTTKRDLRTMWAHCACYMQHKVNAHEMTQDEAILDWIWGRPDGQALPPFEEEVFMCIALLQRIVIDGGGKYDADEQGEIACVLKDLVQCWSMESYRVAYNLWKEYVGNEEEESL